MKNPLRRRLLRDLKSEFGKYLVIFLLLAVSIGVVSGMTVSADSMIAAYNESFTKYNIEDGHFATAKAMNKAQRKAAEKLGITVYDNRYLDVPLASGSVLRVFRNREAVNRACVMEGRLAEAPGEIAIDRMFADNNGLAVGDTIEREAGGSWTITGLVALSDYSTMFASNNDSMFDALQFGVSVVTAEEFEALPQDELVASYSWKYDETPAEGKEERDRAEDLLEGLNREVSLKAFVPRYANQAITFTGEDMVSDEAGTQMFFYIIMAIIAFVFAVTVSTTIQKEAPVIGTLRAAGYTKGELLRHYLSMPLLVTLVSAVVGNVLGYTVFQKVCADLYYNSYSLPTYVVLWNANAFLLTTVVPLVMMLVINIVVLSVRLSLPPLKFLRRDLSRRKHRSAVKLAHGIPFFTRFRLRVFGQNLGNYLVLFIGVTLANLMLMFGLGLPGIIHSFQDEMETNLIADYQYILSVPVGAFDEENKLESAIEMIRFRDAVTTENPDAEAFSVYELESLGEMGARKESIMLYGVEPGSRYIDGEIPQDGVLISASYAQKFGLEPGDSITLKEPYEDETYVFPVAGIYDYSGAVCVFMDKGLLNETFDLGEDFFCGYFSSSPIEDIDEEYLGTVIDLEALTKISRQLDHSMGGMATVFQWASVLFFVILIYLLSKTIIEKNAQSISMAKILGYTSGEVSRLYIIPTTLVVVICLFITVPITEFLLVRIFIVVMREFMSGWLTIAFGNELYLQMLAMGAAAYAVVAFFEYRRVRRVPMDEALKNVE